MFHEFPISTLKWRYRTVLNLGVMYRSLRLQCSLRYAGVIRFSLKFLRSFCGEETTFWISLRFTSLYGSSGSISISIFFPLPTILACPGDCRWYSLCSQVGRILSRRYWPNKCKEKLVRYFQQDSRNTVGYWIGGLWNNKCLSISCHTECFQNLFPIFRLHLLTQLSKVSLAISNSNIHQ